jgi:acyl-coenzyme A synthetase/AMP-(fatty) acid ligase
LAVTASWNIGGLLRDLALHDRHPAVIAFAEEGGSETWDRATIADKALRLACGLRDTGVGTGKRVALWAPNSTVWIVVALAVLSVGGVVVPIDDLADAEQLKAALVSGAAQAIFTTARHLESSGEVLRAHAARVILIDKTEGDGRLAKGWQSLLDERTLDLLAPAPDEPAVLSWTSGTTGSPKAFFLTHRNIATNIEALQKLNLVGPRDRALLPLPLHHAYPFVVGMLTTLTIGTPIVLPGGTTGPMLVRAMRDAEVTTSSVCRASTTRYGRRLKHASQRAVGQYGSCGARCSNPRTLCSAHRDCASDDSCSPQCGEESPAPAAAGFGRIPAGKRNRGPSRDSWLDRAVRLWAGGDCVIVHRQPAGSTASGQRRAAARGREDPHRRPRRRGGW